MKNTSPIIATAPMMQRTDQHCRTLFGYCNPQAILYTEMVTADSMIHAPKQKKLQYHPSTNPTILQLGGSEPEILKTCTQTAEVLGFSGVNLNVGCPSERVQHKQIGACLMAQPKKVATCIKAMQQSVSIPVSIKTRIGIDTQDNYQFLHEFIKINADAGCKTFIIHARKAWLKGLNPRQNRSVPKLNYPRVYQIAKDFPHCQIIINGGINNYTQIQQHLQYTDGVMIGRYAYANPFFLHQIAHPHATEQWQQQRIRIMQEYFNYLNECDALEAKALAPLINFFHGQPHAYQAKQYIIQLLHKKIDLKTCVEALTEYLLQQHSVLDLA